MVVSKMNEQQNFWANAYAEEYIQKNSQFDREKGIAAWRLMLAKANPIGSILECGCNIGRNIDFLNHVFFTVQNKDSLKASSFTIRSTEIN